MTCTKGQRNGDATTIRPDLSVGTGTRHRKKGPRERERHVLCERGVVWREGMWWRGGRAHADSK